jgi:molybdopterin-containing oxidoreductase family iron-sulfur binding subunit
MEKRIWTSPEELRNDPETLARASQEFPEDPFEEAINGNGPKTNRRDFLKAMGFGLTAATLAACQKTPVRYAIPYVNKPVDMVVGEANYYASTFWDGQDYGAVLVKTREGRPIFVEGNAASSVNQGGLSARGNASVLSLYDGYRLKEPSSSGDTGSSWDKIDNYIKTQLAEDSQIRILAGTVISPSAKQLIADFAGKYRNAKLVQYDAVSAEGILMANEMSFGKRVLPSYRFAKAEVIVGVNADFLGTWISPTQYTKDYIPGRKVVNGKRTMSRHIQLESTMTSTGAMADLRIPIKPSHEGALILRLYNIITGAGNSGGMELPGNMLANIATELKAAQGKSLVVSGSNDPYVQVLVNGINAALGNIGQTVDLDNPSNLRQGSHKALGELISEMNGGTVDAVFVLPGCNPAYNYPDAEAFKAAFAKPKIRVSFNPDINETAELCNFMLPSHHDLESWGDAEPEAGKFSLQQPTIQPLFKTRQWQSSMLVWLGQDADYYKYVKNYWTAKVLANGAQWNQALHDGVYDKPAAEAKAYEFKATAAEEAKVKVGSAYGAGEATDLILYTKAGIGDGAMAGNPWLQELPDGITKCTRDNYVCVPMKMAEAQGWRTGDLVTVQAGKFNETLPVYILPGMHPQTVAVALGYGRTKVSKAGNGVGKNAYPAMAMQEGVALGFAKGVTLSRAEGSYELAMTQTQGTLAQAGRAEQIVKEKTLVEFLANPNEIKEHRKAMQEHLVNLYPDYISRPGQSIRWAMAIDLNACTGCGACVVACSAENNVPVVGKREIMIGREMHWIRIDRYFSSPAETRDEVDASEHPEEFPEVVFQPMLCQHCNNAPCENVCPVLATVHSDEGMNQMAYNRCFGTRYCANNCPYKVRRFNWFDYTNSERWQYNPIDDLGRMVLNPDVTVRARGVMEKCSWCVQRLQDGKLKAKREGRALRENDYSVACAKTCPAGAITFGNVNDPNSTVAKMIEEGHLFYVIEEVKALPSVGYLARVRNKRETDSTVVS